MRHLPLFVLLSVAACAKAPPQDTALPAVAVAAVPPGDPVEGARVARRTSRSISASARVWATSKRLAEMRCSMRERAGCVVVMA